MRDIPGFKFSITLSFARTAEAGSRPPERALPRTRISGLT